MKLIITCKLVVEPEDKNVPEVFEAYRKRFGHLRASGVLGPAELRYLIQTGEVVVPVAEDEEVKSDESNQPVEPEGVV